MALPVRQDDANQEPAVAQFLSNARESYSLVQGDAEEVLNHKNGSKPGDVWHIIPEDEWRKDTHYAVFPLELCELPIKATCPQEGILLDPFVGTGTALVAAVMMGRRGIGIDTSASYLIAARKRLHQVLINRSAKPEQRSLFDV